MNDERVELNQRLNKLEKSEGVYIPGHEELDNSELRDHVQAQEHKARERHSGKREPLRDTPLSKGERDAIKERLDFNRRRANGERKWY